MIKFRIYAHAYFESVVFYFILVFILANLVRLLNFGLDCIDDCYAYDPNPFTIYKAMFVSFWGALAGGLHGVVNIHERFRQKKQLEDEAKAKVEDEDMI